MAYSKKFIFQFLYQAFRKSLLVLMISTMAFGSISPSWAAGPASGSSSSEVEDDPEERKTFLAVVQQASRINPIQEAAPMYGNTTPMVTVKNEERTIAVLKQEMRDERNTYITESLTQGSSSLKVAGFGSTLAPGYIAQSLSLTYDTSTGPEVRNFSGIVQPVVVLRPHANTPKTTLTDILDKIPHPHGALPALALWSRSHSTKWVSREEDEELDLTHYQDYNIHERMKEVPVTPMITVEERSYCLNSISREAVEGDFVGLGLLALSGDSQWRNWALELNPDGTLLGVKSVDYERLYLYDSSFDMTAPLAIRLPQGLYPFSDGAREKILGWDLDAITRSLDDSRRMLVLPFLERLQHYLKQTPTMSLLDIYFHIFADIQTIFPGVKKSVGFAWAKGYENTDSRLTPVEELVALMRANLPLQDPAYAGLESQWPDMNFIQEHFSLGLHFQGSAVDYLRNRNATDDQSSAPKPRKLYDFNEALEELKDSIDKLFKDKEPKIDVMNRFSKIDFGDLLDK